MFQNKCTSPGKNGFYRKNVNLGGRSETIVPKKRKEKENNYVIMINTYKFPSYSENFFFFLCARNKVFSNWPTSRASSSHCLHDLRSAFTKWKWWMLKWWTATRLSFLQIISLNPTWDQETKIIHHVNKLQLSNR